MKKVFCLFLSLFVIYSESIMVYAEEEIDETFETEEVSPSSSQEFEIVSLEDCIDGNTARFRLQDDSIIKARFLGIDVPTIHPINGEEPYAKEARDYTCSMLTDATVIKLEYDENSNKEDSYGRKLVWVFVDDILLQNSLVSQGYAKITFADNNYKYNSLLREEEALAQESRLGIWKIEETTPEPVSEEQETKEEVHKKEKKEKNFFHNILDAIIDFFNDLLEKIVELIEDML